MLEEGEEWCWYRVGEEEDGRRPMGSGGEAKGDLNEGFPRSSLGDLPGEETEATTAAAATAWGLGARCKGEDVARGDVILISGEEQLGRVRQLVSVNALELLSTGRCGGDIKWAAEVAPATDRLVTRCWGLPPVEVDWVGELVR